MIKNNILILLGALCIVSLFSCEAKVKHEDEIKYYVTMWTTREHQIKSWNKAIKAYNNAYNLSTWNEDGSIPSGRADSVELMIKKHVATIDSSITVISNVKEIDKEIHLVQMMNNYLNHSKKFWEEGMIQAVENMRSGLKKLSDMQTMAMDSYGEDGDKVRSEGDELQYKIQRFAEKHKITSEDLSKEKLE